MSRIEAFFAENNKPKGNVKFIASRKFKDEKGEPIPWELKIVPTETAEEIKNRTNFYTDPNKIAGPFAIEMAAESVVFPDLRNVDLQDSYHVKSPQDLLYKLLDAAELDVLKIKVLQVNGYGEGFNELAGEAKN